MTIGDLLRGVLGKQREDAAPSNNPTPAQPVTVKTLTEQELEQVEGGASGVGFPITSISYMKEIPSSIGDPNVRAYGNPTV
jgi:bacteriocin-like protein